MSLLPEPDASRLFPLEFTRSGITAGLTASQVLAPGNAPGYTLPEGAQLVGITRLFTGSFSAGQIVVRCRKNGSADTDLELTATDGTGSDGVATGEGAEFDAGDYVQCEVDTDGSFNGTSGVWGFVFWFKVARI